MIEDFRKVDIPPHFHVDVCIVGAGAAGIALAAALSQAGLTVAMVESGGMEPTDDVQQLNRGEVEGDKHFKGLVEGRARSFGGSTKLWYGQCIRYEAIDFEERAWVPHSGWPIRLADLDPYYDRAEKFFAIAGQRYDASVYRGFGLEKPEFDPERCSIHFTIYSPLVDLGNIHLETLSSSRNIHIFLHANVTEVTTNGYGTEATGVCLKSRDGKTSAVRARAVVLCAGGIENARLLLLSNRIKTDGLGNDRDLVGRFFQDHPNGQTATLETEDAARVGEWFSLLYRTPLRYFPKFALSPRLQASERVLNCNAHLVFEYPPDSGIAAGKAIYRSLRRRQRPPNVAKHIKSVLMDLPESFRAAKQFFVDGKSPLGKPSRIRLQCYLEQEPDPNNRVRLDAALDAIGLRKTRLSWIMHEEERRTLQVMTDAMQYEFFRLGVGTLVPDAWLKESGNSWREHLSDGFHHIGTTRMAMGADLGVVDTQCKLFDVAGLFIAGSSVFPTSGYGNPTLTIVALALRLADHLIETLS